MAWSFPLKSINKSPTGFWPHPEKERFHRKQTPWKVPKKRKSKGRYHQSNLFYDHQKESVQYRVSDEVITYNRFMVLTEEDSLVDQIIPPEEISLPEESMNIIFQSQLPEETSFSEDR